MMPDLGRYVGTVLGAYGVTLLLLGLLVGLSVRRSARIARELARMEGQSVMDRAGEPK